MREETLTMILRKEGLRSTAFRRGLVRVFVCAKLPLSVANILFGLQKRGLKVNKTTVYRELAVWTTLDLIEKVRLAEDEASYELKGEHHHHLVCVNCETVEDVVLNESALSSEEKKVQKEKKFLTIRHSLEFFGICQKCQI